MAPRRSSTGSLGRCPDCETEIPRSGVIIEYEKGDDMAAYAECPDCRNVVRPT